MMMATEIMLVFLLPVVAAGELYRYVWELSVQRIPPASLVVSPKIGLAREQLAGGARLGSKINILSLKLYTCSYTSALLPWLEG